MMRAFLHSVHFYMDDATLIDRLRCIMIPALKSRDAGLVIATPAHLAQFISALSKWGGSPERAQMTGRLVLVDAFKALNRFMVAGRPNAPLFFEFVGSLVETAQSAAATGCAVVFGEMVAILWEQGDKASALTLEGWWNVALSGANAQLHCAYPATSIGDADLKEICDQHTHHVTDQWMCA
jgi:hypothetical protein